MSVESFKASISKASDEAEYTLEKEGVTGKKTEEVRRRENGVHGLLMIQLEGGAWRE